MRKAVKILGIVVLVGLVGAALYAGVALADDSATPTPGPLAQIQDLATRMKEAFANKLGKSTDQLDQAWSSARSEVVQQAVDEGIITQEQADKILSQDSTFMGKGMLPFGGRKGFGPGEGMRLAVPFGVDIMGEGMQTIANTLGISVDDLQTQLQSGKSVADIAGAKLADVKAALTTQVTTAVNQAVTDGKLTQTQADKVLGNLSTQLDKILNSTISFGERFGGRGGHRGFDAPCAPEATPEAGTSTTGL